MYLDEINKTIDQDFGINWFKPNFAVSSDLSIDFNIYIENFLKVFYKNINYILLSGEYLSLTENKEKAISILQKLFKATENANILNPELKRVLENYFKNLIFFELLYVIDDMLVIENTLDDNENIFNIINEINEKPNNLNRRYLNKLFYLNYRLTIADHKYICDEESIRNVLTIYYELIDKYIDINYAYIILDKCKLLLGKLQKCLRKTKKEFIFSFNNMKIDFLIEDYHGFYFKEMEELSNENITHLNDDKCREILKGIDQKRSTNEIFNSFEYYFYIKYYKNKNQQIKDLEFLINIYIEKHKEEHKVYDANAFNSNLIFLHNNILELMIKNKFPFDEIRKKYIEILNLQKELNNINYFSSYFYSKYLCSHLEEELKNNTWNPEKIKSIISEFENSVTISYQKVKICLKKFYIPFQSVFNDCVLEINLPELPKIFIRSTFVVPIEYNYVLNELNELRDKKIKYENQFLKKYIENSQDDIIKSKNEISSMRDEVQKSTRRQIEILGIFAAIVLFTSSSVQLFKEIDSFEQALLFMLTFGYSISCFVILIWLVTQDTKESIPRRQKVLIWTFIIATIFVVTFLIYSFNVIYFYKIAEIFKN